MLDGANASDIERLWSTLSFIATLLHSWLSVQAGLDWQAARTAPPNEHFERWRVSSAGYYFAGQFLLALPAILHLYIGIDQMLLPPPPTPERQQAADTAQALLIIAEIFFAAAGLLFWRARGCLQRWTLEQEKRYARLAQLEAHPGE